MPFWSKNWLPFWSKNWLPFWGNNWIPFWRKNWTGYLSGGRTDYLSGTRIGYLSGTRSGYLSGARTDYLSGAHSFTPSFKLVSSCCTFCSFLFFFFQLYCMFFDLRLLITFVCIVKLFLLPNTNYSLAEATHQWRLCTSHILNNRSKCFVVLQYWKFNPDFYRVLQENT